MLNVTQAALAQLSELLERAEVDSSQGIRLVQDQGELGLQVDDPQEGDQVIAAEERPVLLVDANLSSALEGATLDAVDTNEGPQLTLVGPESGGDSADSRNGAH